MLTVSALLLGVALFLTGTGLIGTVLALQMETRGVETGRIGLVMAAYFAGLALGCLRADRVISRAGHIRAFAAFAAALSASFLGHALTTGTGTWLVLRGISGFCLSGLYMATESWLNDRATDAMRGRVLSFYMVTVYGSLGAGQLLLNLADPDGFMLLCGAALLASLAVLPVALTRTQEPELTVPAPVSFRRLMRRLPLGEVAAFGSGMISSSLFAMGPIFARRIGLDVPGVSVLMAILIASGLLLQWPVGNLSDRGDRRIVLAGVSLGVAAAGAALASLGPGSPEMLFALTTLFGGLVFVIYPIGVAHAFDRAEPGDMLQTSSGLLLAYAVGSTLGPLGASRAMHALGPYGLFLFGACVGGALGLYALWRIATVAAVPAGEREHYVGLPRTTPAAAELDPRAEGPGR